MGLLKTFTAIVLDILYPRYCLCCGRALLSEPSPAVYLCRSCAPDIEFTHEKSCSICSKQLISEKETCIRCRNRQYAFTRNVSLFSYTDAVKILLQGYKFEGYKSLAQWFAEKLFTSIISDFGYLPIVPVPSRKKKRGWDHIERITRVLARDFGLEILPLLSRKGKKAQKTLGYEERLRNMSGSIVPVEKGGTVPEEVILLDDVFTTGATAHECSLVLKLMGVKTVYVLTIALD